MWMLWNGKTFEPRPISDEVREAAEQIARVRRQLVAERLRREFRVIKPEEEERNDRCDGPS
jgi:hypothetical protein